MPSRYSSEGSLVDAITLANNLGIELSSISIEDTFSASLDSLADHFNGPIPDLAQENLQSRIRGLLMMALSNQPGWLVLTTGNKSEVAVGYATLYGIDMTGAYAVIKDVPKTLVYRLARYRNGLNGELIPESVLTKPPSAELRPGQTDQDSLPPYDVLDPILKAYVEEDRTFDEIVRMGFNVDAVRQTIRPRRPCGVQTAPGPAGSQDHPEKLRPRQAHAHRQPLLTFLTQSTTRTPPQPSRAPRR